MAETLCGSASTFGESGLVTGRPLAHGIVTATDLVTTHEATRAGFIAVALERNRQATPTIAQARALYARAVTVATPADLGTLPDLQEALLTAAGVSDKARKYFNEQDKQEAIQGLVANFLEPAGADFVEELVYRFLLTKGDALGGSMRNLTGLLAQRKLTRAVLASLSLQKRAYTWRHRSSGKWIPASADEIEIEEHARALLWQSSGENRLLLYNANIPLIKKNIDIVLLRSDAAAFKAALTVPEAYLALGELKGGIDPGGADEHWKTAGTALDRIRSGFAGASCFPLTFYIGAAIVSSMAQELWGQLETGRLAHAANLTNSTHVASLAAWLTSL